MNLLKKMAGFFQPKDHDLGRLIMGPGVITDSGEGVNERIALSLSTVWACVNLISGTTSTLPLQVMQTTRDGTREPFPDHPLYTLLHDSPNADQTAVDFLDWIATDIEFQGSGIARKVKSGERLIALDPAPAGTTSRRRLPDGRIEYSWTKNGRNYRETEENVLHIRGPGGDPLGGMSTLSFARESFGLAKAQDRQMSSLMKNGAVTNVAIQFDKWLTVDQRKIAEEEFPARYMGTLNAGKPFILEGGTKLQQLTINPIDAQMLESRAYSVEDLCRFFSVPPVMIGHTSKTTSWPTGVEQQVLLFTKFTMRRRLKRIEAAMMKQLLTAEDRARGVVIEFNLEGLLRGDTAGRAAWYQAMTGMGAYTINDVRRYENKPPIEGGDVPMMQSQNIPITQAGQITSRQQAGE